MNFIWFFDKIILNDAYLRLFGFFYLLLKNKCIAQELLKLDYDNLLIFTMLTFITLMAFIIL